MAIEPVKIVWTAAPEEHDYCAAHDYLTLQFDGDQTRKIVKKLRKCEVKQRRAKDVIRASGLPVLPIDNMHVAGNLANARSGHKLSPILLVRTGFKLIIADGYHRACAAYYASEDTAIDCVLVSLE